MNSITTHTYTMNRMVRSITRSTVRERTVRECTVRRVRLHHVMFTSIHLRFPHFTCDHVSQQVMITPDNVAYYAQLFILVT